jgi:RNA polymerase sigma factor (sigma-70 family)
MEPDVRPPLTSPATVADSAAALLCRYVEENAGPLLGILRGYVRRAGIARLSAEHAEQSGTEEAATALLNEVLVEALEHTDRFDSTRQPMAWLLGIAANLIKRRQSEQASRYKRESNQSAEDVLERLSSLAGQSAAGQMEASLEVERLLARVSAEERRALNLYWIEGLDSNELAGALGVTPAAARQRLTRAMKSLRRAANAAGERREP